MSNTIQREISICSCDISTPVPATAEEFDKLTAPGECVAGAVTESIYRGYATALRGALTAAITAATGVAKADTDKLTDKGKAVKESDDSFVKRVKAEGIISSAKVQELCDAVVKALPYTTWLTNRGVSTGGAIAQEYLKSADGVLEAWANGTSTQEIFLSRVAPLLGEVTLPEEPTRDDIALVIKRFKKVEGERKFV